MTALVLVLLIIAAGSFAFAAFGRPSSSRVDLVALGLLFWVLAVLIPAFTAALK